MASDDPTPMREMTPRELIERASADALVALGEARSEEIVRDLRLAVERLPARTIPPTIRPGGEAVALCPVCGSSEVVRLVDDWRQQDDLGGTAIRALPIVGCGNPWHYATRTLGDGPPLDEPLVAVGPGRTAGPFVDLATHPIAGEAVLPGDALVEVRPGESVVVQIVDPAPGVNRVVVHRTERELGHDPGVGAFTEATCRRCGLMVAYAVRDQVVCGGLAGEAPFMG